MVLEDVIFELLSFKVYYGMGSASSTSTLPFALPIDRNASVERSGKEFKAHVYKRREGEKTQRET